MSNQIKRLLLFKMLQVCKFQTLIRRGKGDLGDKNSYRGAIVYLFSLLFNTFCVQLIIQVSPATIQVESKLEIS